MRIGLLDRFRKGIDFHALFWSLLNRSSNIMFMGFVFLGSLFFRVALSFMLVLFRQRKVSLCRMSYPKK